MPNEKGEAIERIFPITGVGVAICMRKHNFRAGHLTSRSEAQTNGYRFEVGSTIANGSVQARCPEPAFDGRLRCRGSDPFDDRPLPVQIFEFKELACRKGVSNENVPTKCHRTAVDELSDERRSCRICRIATLGGA